MGDTSLSKMSARQSNRLDARLANANHELQTIAREMSEFKHLHTLALDVTDAASQVRLIRNALAVQVNVARRD